MFVIEFVMQECTIIEILQKMRYNVKSIGVRVTRSLVLYVCFVDRCLSFCTFSFGHCVGCSSSICGI
jgi:hypothetical protein